MVLTHRSTRAAATENQQELVAQRQATKLAPVTKNAKATRTIEEEQAAQERPVSNMGVSRSRKRRRDDEEQAAQEPPVSSSGSLL